MHNLNDPHDYQKVAVDHAVWPDDPDKKHDIAIVILAEPVTFDDTVQPICLPANGLQAYEV